MRTKTAQDAYRKFYDTGAWSRRRYLQLLHEPWCRFCKERGIAVAATVADHIEPHRGNWGKFRLGALQSLCADCHNRAKRFAELRGYSQDIGPDGWPTDPKHPANRGVPYADQTEQKRLNPG